MIMVNFDGKISEQKEKQDFFCSFYLARNLTFWTTCRSSIVDSDQIRLGLGLLRLDA